MRAIHRRLAWIAGLVAVLWAATGFLHPIMSWTAPRPVAMAPPHTTLSLGGVEAPGPLFAAQGLREARGVRLIESKGVQTWLAFGADGSTLALDARTGASLADAERDYAIALARHYTGRQDAAAHAQRLTRFDLFYPSINHILPIWDVRFDDGLAVYVDPRTGRLVTMADPLRRGLLFAFQNVHTLQFLSGAEPLRKTLIVLLIAATMATALFGLIMSLSAKGRNIRAAHRLIGLVASPLLFMFAGSGLFHVLTSTPAASSEPASFSIAGLAAPRLVGAIQTLSATADRDGRAIWRAQATGQALYFSHDGRIAALDDAGRARQLALADPDADALPITHFTAEYGFANKRLPVWRVEAPSGVRFADVEEGLIAATAPSGLQATESWAFNTIHKWRFAEPLGKLTRDLLMMLAVLLIAATALIGLTLTKKDRAPRA